VEKDKDDILNDIDDETNENKEAKPKNMEQNQMLMLLLK
jgi:hypothetical protein